jgi:branched-chain amino acid transport system ATP-binding protein
MLMHVEEVSVSFGGVQALKGVSFAASEGEILGIIGPNGAGKTTLFNIINGVYEPDEGDVFFAGERITGKKPYQVSKKGIARTFQVAQPFRDMSILENVATAALTRVDNVDEAFCEAFDVISFCELSDKPHERAGNLPTISQRRLELAKALALKPKVILLDEIMAGLNINECSQAIDLVRKIKSDGVTVIMVEHVMQAVMSLCEKVIVLNQGRLIAQDTPSAIANDPVVVEAYLGKGGGNAENL